MSTDKCGHIWHFMAWLEQSSLTTTLQDYFYHLAFILQMNSVSPVVCWFAMAICDCSNEVYMAANFFVCMHKVHEVNA